MADAIIRNALHSTAMELTILSEELAVCRLAAQDDIPDWGWNREFCSITRTAQELSIVCRASDVPRNIKAERGWRALRVAGPLDFSLSGVLAGLATPLAEAAISIFSVSTFDTDYLLVRSYALEQATMVLRGAGHIVNSQ
jgi:hypothetical protein